MQYFTSEGTVPPVPEKAFSSMGGGDVKRSPERLGVVLQARMSSSRLPGKVLRPLAGKPLLGYLLERLERLGTLVVVATSEEPADDPIAEFSRQAGVPCWRGPLGDVARRLLDCARGHALDAFARVCGDSPLLDLELVRRGMAAYGERRPDFVTNCLPKAYPAGQSVEILRTDALETAYARFYKQDHYEHVTAYFYEHQEDFSVCRFTPERGYDGVHLAVDQPRDLERLAAVIGRMDRPHWTYGVDELVRLYGAAGGGRDGEER